MDDVPGLCSWCVYPENSRQPQNKPSKGVGHHRPNISHNRSRSREGDHGDGIGDMDTPSNYMISEDEAYAVYTMLERGRWVHLGRSHKPYLQMSRRIKKSHVRLRKGKVIWFQDKLLANRVHMDVVKRMKLSQVRRAGDNRCPKFNIAHADMEAEIRTCARVANIDIISETDIYRAKGLRDARILRRYR